MGLANDRSLAWGIARALGDQGAELAFSYQGEALEKRVRPLAHEVGSDLLIDCDVSDMKALDKAFADLRQTWDALDFVVHAIGFSDKNELRGKFVETSVDNFLLTMNISVYSFIAVAQRARQMMTPGGFLHDEGFFPSLKVMGRTLTRPAYIKKMAWLMPRTPLPASRRRTGASRRDRRGPLAAPAPR